jgi:hypothetical protein
MAPRNSGNLTCCCCCCESLAEAQADSGKGCMQGHRDRARSKESNVQLGKWVKWDNGTSQARCIKGVGGDASGEGQDMVAV